MHDRPKKFAFTLVFFLVILFFSASALGEIPPAMCPVPSEANFTLAPKILKGPEDFDPIYTYDSNGNRSSMIDPTGLTTYTYDTLNRLISITNNKGLTTTFTYDSLSRRTSMTHANGVVTTYDYDKASQLTKVTHQRGTTTINSFSYTYDKVGNRQTKVDRNGTYNYSYDNLNRLIRADTPLVSNPLETYTYDAVGNRVDSNQNGLSTLNSGNQLTEDAAFRYQYNNNGNLIWKTNKITGEVTSYEYDAQNKLDRIVSPDVTVNYKYDGLGRRAEKELTQAGLTKVTRFIYDSQNVLLEIDGSNNIVARYTHGPGIDEPLIMERGGASFFYQTDGLGSIAEITDSAGVVKQRYTYSSFGKIESQLDTSFANPYTFTAREFDPEIALYFYRFRIYDPLTGRFLSEDPLGFVGSFNFYEYVAGNPVVATDAFGLWSPGAHDLIIQHAFQSKLSPAEIASIQQASRDFDRRTGIDPADSHLHSMRRRGQDPAAAIRQRDQFINDTIADARRLAQAGNRTAALRRIGEACHPLMDSSSPMHVMPNGEPREWIPWRPFGHSPNDLLGKETVSNLTPEILSQQDRLLNNVYDRVFGK